MANNSKPWYASKTIWGTLLLALGILMNMWSIEGATAVLANAFEILGILGIGIGLRTAKSTITK